MIVLLEYFNFFKCNWGICNALSLLHPHPQPVGGPAQSMLLLFVVKVPIVYNTVKLHLVATFVIRPPHYSGHLK